MRVVDSPQLLQASPHLSATARGKNQLVIDDEPLKDVAFVDHRDVRDLFGTLLRLEPQELDQWNHIVTPPTPRNPCETPRVAAVACHEVGERETETFGNPLMIFVFVAEVMDRPSDHRLRVVVNGEPRCQIGSRGGVVSEGGKGARLHRRRRHEIRRNLGSACAGSRKHAEQRRPIIRQTLQYPRPHLV